MTPGQNFPFWGQDIDVPQPSQRVRMLKLNGGELEVIAGASIDKRPSTAGRNQRCLLPDNPGRFFCQCEQGGYAVIKDATG